VQRVYYEPARSLIHHGFRRILFLNSHTGNQYVTAYVADRINQETSAIAVELTTTVAPLRPRETTRSTQFDRHAGVGETSGALYLFPNLVDLRRPARTT
jgi:creatinine amidohydrolase